MGLLSGITPFKPIEPCKIGKLVSDLDPDDATILKDAFQDPRWNAFSLCKALGERGIRVSADTLRDHMRGTCRCSKI